MFTSLKTDGDADANRQSIALVDPNPRASLVESLEGAGYRVLSYTHPLKALECIVDESISLAIIAPELPWMSGEALARTLRDSYRVSNVVMIDDDTSDSAVLSRVRSGAPIEGGAASRLAKTKVRKTVNGRTGRRIIVRSPRPT